MKENTTKQIEHWQIISKTHVEVYAYRCAAMSKLILHMTCHMPGRTPLTFDIDLLEWKSRRHSLGKLIGFEKYNDVTKFYYSIKKLRA